MQDFKLKVPSLVTDYYKQGRASLELFIQTNREARPYSQYFSDSGFPLVFPVMVLLALALLMFLFFIVWIIAGIRAAICGVNSAIRSISGTSWIAISR